MTTPNEIRKGLYFNVPRKDQCPFRIDVIEYLDDNFAKVGMKLGKYKIGDIEVEGHPLTWYHKELEPIPLTEGWLIKFGFEKDYEGDFMFSFNGRIYYYNLEKGYLMKDFKAKIKLNQFPFYNVHQLQNLYYTLTNQELKIEL